MDPRLREDDGLKEWRRIATTYPYQRLEEEEYMSLARGLWRGMPLTLSLSQRERGLNPFSPWEKVRMRENDGQPKR